MNITIVGYGNMGSGLASLAVKAGHHVTLTGKQLSRSIDLAAKLGAHAVELKVAAQGADLIVLATPYSAAGEVLAELGDLAGKTVIDISNPVKADFSGLSLGFNTSAAEEIQRLAPTAHIVKAFNTIFAQVFSEGPDFGPAGKASVFIAGDDTNARNQVDGFAQSLGFSTLHTGGLSSARYLEPLGMLNISLAYGLGHGTGIAPTWLHRS